MICQSVSHQLFFCIENRETHCFLVSLLPHRRPSESHYTVSYHTETISYSSINLQQNHITLPMHNVSPTSAIPFMTPIERNGGIPRLYGGNIAKLCKRAARLVKGGNGNYQIKRKEEKEFQMRLETDQLEKNNADVLFEVEKERNETEVKLKNEASESELKVK